MAAWDIAKHFGCHYIGDCNAFEHGGTFYSLTDWQYGYASTVDIWKDPETGETVVECGTVNQCEYTIDDLCQCYGCTPEEVNDHLVFDWCKSQWGCETLEDFGGPYVKRFSEDADETEFWAQISGWLRGLSAE